MISMLIRALSTMPPQCTWISALDDAVRLTLDKAQAQATPRAKQHSGSYGGLSARRRRVTSLSTAASRARNQTIGPGVFDPGTR